MSNILSVKKEKEKLRLSRNFSDIIKLLLGIAKDCKPGQVGN